MKDVPKLIALMICMTPICNGQSTRSITTPTDSLRILLPKGYIVFTEAAARLALKNKINSEAFQIQLTESQSIVQNQDSIITDLTSENQAMRIEIRRLKFRNTLKDIEKWGYRTIIILGAILLKPK